MILNVRLTATALLALLCCSSLPVWAGSEAPVSLWVSETSTPQAESVPLNALTLEGLLQQVEKNHPKLIGADIQRRIAASKVLEKQGAFDPFVTLETDYLRYNDFAKPGNAAEPFDNDLTLQWLSPLGIRLFSGARFNRGEIKPPIYPTGSTGEYFMGFRVPLLRGFRVNDKAIGLRQAEVGVPQADAFYRQARLELLRNAAFAYWDWVAAKRKLDVAQELLGLSEFRLNAIKERTKVGDLPAIDAVEAAQEVQRRVGNLNKQLREFQKNQLKLNVYLWESPSTPAQVPPPERVPQQLAPPRAITLDDWMDGRRSALDQRPELKVLNFDRNIVKLDRDLARNLRLPILDIFAFPGYDTGNESIGATVRAGVSLMVPLRNRTAQGQVQVAEYKLQKLDADQRLLLQRVLLEVDDAVSNLNATFQQYQAAQEEFNLAMELELAERERFEYGDSTLFLVNQRERSRAEVANKVIELEALFQQAMADYRASTGLL